MGDLTAILGVSNVKDGVLGVMAAKFRDNLQEYGPYDGITLAEGGSNLDELVTRQLISFDYTS
ncbi:MAG: hypothetical protein ABIH11_01015 [Candidatus Altiarchaeota archaeon]